MTSQTYSQNMENLVRFPNSNTKHVQDHSFLAPCSWKIIQNTQKLAQIYFLNKPNLERKHLEHSPHYNTFPHLIEKQHKEIYWQTLHVLDYHLEQTQNVTTKKHNILKRIWKTQYKAPLSNSPTSSKPISKHLHPQPLTTWWTLYTPMLTITPRIMTPHANKYIASQPYPWKDKWGTQVIMKYYTKYHI